SWRTATAPPPIVEQTFVVSWPRSSELTLLTLVTWPSTGPVDHGSVSPALTAVRSVRIPRTRLTNGGNPLALASSSQASSSRTERRATKCRRADTERRYEWVQHAGPRCRRPR